MSRIGLFSIFEAVISSQTEGFQNAHFLLLHYLIMHDKVNLPTIGHIRSTTLRIKRVMSIPYLNNKYALLHHRFALAIVRIL